jgi:hypothetical protein
MHNASKVQMGSVGMSGYNADDFAADPATFPAGTAVRLKSDGTISVTKADGSWLGISRGRSLSSTKKLSVVTDGRLVPVLVERQPARGSISITNYSNLLTTTPDSITVGGTAFTAQSGAATLGQATFRAATSNAATAASLAAQINAHATAGALVVAAVDSVDDTKVNITAKSNATDGDTIALAYTDNGGGNVGATVSGATLTDSDDSPDFVTLGAKVYFSDSTGKADDASSGATISDAVYASGLLTGLDEDGNEVLAALVDMPGGL